jgi:DNA-binding NarL/FixJ family response regulator
MYNHSEQRKILIVDDQGLIREGLIRIISRQKDLMCCDAVNGVIAARKAVALHKPDLVLSDLLLPDGCGLEMIKELISEHSSLLVLVITQCDETLYAERALRAGAHGYVMKNRPVSEIPTAIRAVLAGEYYVSPRVAAVALHRMAGGKSENQREGIANLTDREILVFQLLGAGIDSKGVAAKLHLSIKTVETHRENIKHKLKLPNAAELIRHATNWVNHQGSSHHLSPEIIKAELSAPPLLQ